MFRLRILFWSSAFKLFIYALEQFDNFVEFPVPSDQFSENKKKENYANYYNAGDIVGHGKTP
ncbi:MAG TPA: hypothetical protein DCQ83_07360 [Fibrobacteres bacterium]|nr:hypothetical protein [Fibrobacterota bacterium]